ncbi:MAG TPA: hypothetical protein VFU02_21325 [Polyangiaceae bacterium]|nr:hypothetical protein [Polyangiaceae bacterium]
MYRFRYVYASNGRSAFLLDLIHEPERATLRLLWSHSGSNTVARSAAGYGAAQRGGDIEKASLALASFSETTARSQLPGLEFEINYVLQPGSERFGPAWVPRLFARVPDFHSRYGRLTHAFVLGVTLRDLPLAYSWYSVNDLAEARWLLVSALEFSGTDLRIELTAVRMSSTWLGALVVRYQGVTHRFTGLSSAWRVNIGDAGRSVDDKRRFTARVSGGNLDLTLEAEAPLQDFVLLEDHGVTQIQTALFGDCEVRIRTSAAATPVAHRATRTCLLELKS